MMAKKPLWGRYHRPDDDHRKSGATAGGDPSLGKLLLADIRSRYRRNPRRAAGVAFGGALLIALGLVAFAGAVQGVLIDRRRDHADHGAQRRAQHRPGRPEERPDDRARGGCGRARRRPC